MNNKRFFARLLKSGNNYPNLPWKIIGPDTSHWEGLINVNKTFAAGAYFIMPKAGGGTAVGNADAQFRNTWSNARGLLKRSAFWWLTVNRSIRQQAREFAALLREDPGEIEPYVDYEEGNQFWVRRNPVTNKRGINHLDLSHLDGFIHYFHQEFPEWKWPNDIGIYTGKSYWQTYGSREFRYAKHPLWISDPDPVPEPDKIEPWNGDWKFWQTDYAAPGPLFGTDPLSAKGVDMNVYHGNLLDFENEYGGYVELPQEPPPQETGEPMVFTKKGVANKYTNVKFMDGVGQTNLGLQVNDWVLGNYSVTRSDLIDITEIHRAGGSVVPLLKPCKTSVENLTVTDYSDPGTPPPPPEDNTVMIMNFTAEHIHKDRDTGEILERWLGEGSVEMTKVE